MPWLCERDGELGVRAFLRSHNYYNNILLLKSGSRIFLQQPAMSSVLFVKLLLSPVLSSVIVRTVFEPNWTILTVYHVFRVIGWVGSISSSCLYER